MATQEARKLATLTLKEDRAWVFALNYHLDSGQTASEADRYAWEDLVSEFPRLRAFDGCRA